MIAVALYNHNPQAIWNQLIFRICLLVPRFEVSTEPGVRFAVITVHPHEVCLL